MLTRRIRLCWSLMGGSVRGTFFRRRRQVRGRRWGRQCGPGGRAQPSCALDGIAVDAEGAEQGWDQRAGLKRGGLMISKSSQQKATEKLTQGSPVPSLKLPSLPLPPTWRPLWTAKSSTVPPDVTAAPKTSTQVTAGRREGGSVRGRGTRTSVDAGRGRVLSDERRRGGETRGIACLARVPSRDAMRAHVYINRR